ncbi:RhuM family protein [Legionella resiliens]|uniref:Type II toxin-antitoxin system death-on-curing family toxin n=1 Tax=Legionella resiliens TaxID=2905958 RepID=A0ABS8X0R3_9GAMM|nr:MULTISPECIES: RhuM family protein [unclassified Legionella]MCE0723183.1 type II toxin-antitoxin system death-on-curing family toxin [Legionella sp. 9fVS26]MCE3532336.1 type II toxin-antitoxin system death-on-curing family toxin [Legionella sp. 8cVS16]
MSNPILIYQTENGAPRTEVVLQNESVWLTQNQLSELFGTQRPAITKHLKNIFDNHELDESSVCSILERTAEDGKRYKTKFYNLDAIIAVGYRVNSKQATQFRIWATNVLKEYLIQGYTLDRNRLQKQTQQIKKLEKTLRLFQQVQTESLKESEASGLLSVLTNYTHSFVLLNQYDTGNFPKGELNTHVTYVIEYQIAIKAIENLKKKLIVEQQATELFGRPKDNSFEGILGNIIQSFGGEYLYPSIEEQAAHLLYFIIKNHPFSDGNKRIGAFMFIWFLQLNHHHLKHNGDVKINDNALVAIALLVAQSDPSQKDIMIQLIINLIRDAD